MIIKPSTLFFAYNIRILLATLALGLGITSISLGAVSKIRSVEGITEYRLDNGLQVLLFPDNSKETITVNITYHVGSKHENYGETGMAHLLEHLVFKGTPSHPNIAKELSDHGARANGTTWLERTNYYETFNATEENLRWALDLESDRMINSYISQEDLDSEMTVVRNEFERGENDPGRILRERVTSMAYLWHNYGQSTIGARSDIENVKIENLQGFYRKYYQPDNATLLIAGNIDTETILGLVDQYFSPIPKPDRVLPEIYTQDPVQDGEREIIVRRSSDTQIVIAAYHIPSGSHPDFAALDLLDSIIGDGASSRLHKELVEKGQATNAWSWPNRQLESSLFYFQVETNLETDIQETKTSLLSILETLSRAPITREELERAKRVRLKEIEQAQFDTGRLAVDLTEWMATGDWRLFFLHRDRIEDVTLEDLQRVAETYLKAQNRTVGLFIPTDAPDRSPMPPAADIASVLDGYKGNEPIAQGENFDPTPENIDSRTEGFSLGGLEVVLLQKETRGNSVDISLKLGMGNESSLFGKKLLSRTVNAMLTRGIKRLDRQGIQDEFDRLKASGQIRGDAGFSIANYKTSRENVDSLIRFLFEIYTEPTFPQSEHDLNIVNTIAWLEKQASDPRAIAENQLQRHYNFEKPGGIHYAYSYEERIPILEALTRDDLISLYRSMFGASNGTLSIVGDFDPSSVKNVLEETFATWATASDYKRAIRPYKEKPVAEVIIETPDKANAQFAATTNLELNNASDDYPGVAIVNYMLGGGFISSRLATRIRQQDGLSYGVWTYLSSNDNDEESRFVMQAISAPENTDKVHVAFIEEMERAYDEGFNADELEDAKKGFLDRRKVNLSDDERLAGVLRTNLEENHTMKQEQLFIDAVTALKLEDVNAVMRRYFDPSKMTIIKVGDFAKVKLTAEADK